jgi:hypothetical protein
VSIEITREELRALDEKISSLDVYFRREGDFDELDYLEAQNKKLLAKIESLESVIPILEKEFGKLNKININIKSNDCYSNRFTGSEFDETSYE